MKKPASRVLITLGVALLTLFIVGSVFRGLRSFNASGPRTSPAEWNQAVTQMDTMLLRWQERSAASYEHAGAVELAAMARQTADTLRAASGSKSGDAAALLRGSATFIDELLEHQRTYREHIAALEELDQTSLSRVRTPQEYMLRQGLLDSLLQQNAQSNTFWESAPQRFEASLVNAGMSPAGLRRVLLDFQDATADARTLNQLDHEALHALKGVYGVLADELGKWKYDNVQDAFRFRSDAAAERFNRENARLKQAHHSLSVFNAQRLERIKAQAQRLNLPAPNAAESRRRSGG